MNNVWLIRHGESQSNVGDKTTHPSTSNITQRGLLQAECVASYIQQRPDLIVHSPFSRTLQSAKPTLNKFPGIAVEEWPVQEFVYLPHVKYRGTTRVERQAPVRHYWKACKPALRESDESETFIEFIDRMQILFKKLNHSEKHIVVFTHGHVIRAMIWKIITGTLKNDTDGMSQYKSLRQAINIPNAAIVKTRLNKQELQMSQIITHHIKPELFT